MGKTLLILNVHKSSENVDIWYIHERNKARKFWNCCCFRQTYQDLNSCNCPPWTIRKYPIWSHILLWQWKHEFQQPFLVTFLWALLCFYQLLQVNICFRKTQPIQHPHLPFFFFFFPPFPIGIVSCATGGSDRESQWTVGLEGGLIKQTEKQQRSQNPATTKNCHTKEQHVNFCEMFYWNWRNLQTALFQEGENF